MTGLSLGTMETLSVVLACKFVTCLWSLLLKHYIFTIAIC